MAVIKTLTRYDAFLYPVSGKQSARINLVCRRNPGRRRDLTGHRTGH